MQIFSTASVCIIILSCFGVLDTAAKKAGLTVFSLFFAAVLYLMLSMFSIFKATQINVNAAVVLLPMYFAALSASKHEKNNRAGASVLVIFAVVLAIVKRSADFYFPVALSVCYFFIYIIFNKNTAFVLFLAAVLPIMTEVCMAVFDYMAYSYAMINLADISLMNTQVLGVIFTGVIMTLLKSEPKVIKA